MAANRSAGRNIHLYDANDPDTELGGLILTNGVTNANFYSRVEIICLFDQVYTLRDEAGTTTVRSSQATTTLSRRVGSVAVTDEVPLLRTVSWQTGTRLITFRDSVPERDLRCVITGKPALRAEYGIWWGFQSAHIFPLAYEEHWNEHNYGRWVTVPPATESVGTINSVQNGMLLDNTIHMLFDLYAVSINPYDNYKIICFGPDGEGIVGGHLDQRFLNDPHRPVDQLLRWHFRQAVLSNVKGAGEPAVEVDFPPGSDMMGEIMKGPMAAERMEFELFSRLPVQ
ncbi:hypothetical protein EX30DRAFT_350917 [Ascodesmis nigricans]|uniref:Uncharacterized protein n=1 Tax=Ascodesmis nigricans TaxID=341454 RepID=A0A4S2MNE2_9PEZI|nr:hypothetical protein EX30DRAFT_350917 [Ascodesmis nigricans]